VTTIEQGEREASMRKVILAALIAALLGGAPPLAAQGSAIDLSRFDIIGLKLGQPLPEAIEALKKHNPKFVIEIRRVGLERWDNQPACADEAAKGEFAGLPSQCGNWSDGMGFALRDSEQQKKMPPDASLVAGLVAYHDERKRGENIKGFRPPTPSIIDDGEETVALVVTPDPGREKVVLVARAKTYPKQSTGFDDLKSQLFERYAGLAGIVEGLHETSPRSLSVLNLFLGREPLTKSRRDGAFDHCHQVAFDDFSPGHEFSRLSPAWPSRVATPCGPVIRAHVKSYWDNTRYAHGFSVIWFDQGALYKLSRDRVLVAKALRDAQFSGAPGANKDKSKPEKW
jgi:hypothetical protein